MTTPPHNFKHAAGVALGDARLARALAGLPGGLVAQRRAARERTANFDALCEAAKEIKDHALAHLDLYLEAFEAKATAAGTRMHWARTAAEARTTVADICSAHGAQLIAKGKSMVSEELGLNAHLAGLGFDVVETDLGEYVVQIRGEPPSHIIAPAIHLTVDQVADDFRRRHRQFPNARCLDTPNQLVAEARSVMRETFLKADVGITGANFLVAETGSAVIVTNEGNGDLTSLLPKVHVIVTSIEKVVPTLEDTFALLRVLARSGTGQDITAYTTFLTGPRRSGDLEGPEECHIVIVDNGRSELLGSDFREVLRCIRCGACMNHCPVYGAIGGHAYGSVYAGPIGAVLMPALVGIGPALDLPNASSFCGRCEEVCPVKIPLPKLMRQWREVGFSSGETPLKERAFLKAWAFAAKRPALYRLLANFMVAGLAWLAGSRGALRSLPIGRGWTRYRDFPAPAGRTFQRLWAERRKGEKDKT